MAFGSDQSDKLSIHDSDDGMSNSLRLTVQLEYFDHLVYLVTDLKSTELLNITFTVVREIFIQNFNVINFHGCCKPRNLITLFI